MQPAVVSTVPMTSRPLIQALPDESPVQSAPESQPQPNADSLASLVAQQSTEGMSRDLECLATAIYYESKGESLAGQLAVGRVIHARAHSGRFPSSYCGVVLQPSQFSFVHGGALPSVNHSSAQWRKAAAVAEIADAGTWHSPAEGALFFHAASVSPGWHRQRVTRIEHHVFYR